MTLFGMVPSDRVKWHFRRGRIARAKQEWHLEKMAYLLGEGVQQVIRMYGKPPLPAAPESVVYLLGPNVPPLKGDFVKIGYTKNLPLRMEVLQSGSLDQLWLIAFLPGGMALERELHRELHELRVREDWFRYDRAIGEAFLARREQHLKEAA